MNHSDIICTQKMLRLGSSPPHRSTIYLHPTLTLCSWVENTVQEPAKYDCCWMRFSSFYLTQAALSLSTLCPSPNVKWKIKRKEKKKWLINVKADKWNLLRTFTCHNLSLLLVPRCVLSLRRQISIKGAKSSSKARGRRTMNWKSCY